MLVKHFKNFFRPQQSTPSDDGLELTSEQLHRFNFWLDFHPAVEAKYEADTSAERVAHLRWACCVGLVFDNLFIITDVIVHNDIVVLSSVIRLLMLTPGALVLAWLIIYMPARWRERTSLIAMANSISVTTFLFYLSSNPFSLYAFIEMPVVLIFGCMMLVLRFPHAFIFTVTTFLLSTLAILMRSDVGPDLQFVFTFQMFSVCAFVLIGNYKIEAVRRGTYLQELRERVRSKMLERDRHTLTALSNTDFLTGVGNRRCFDDALLARRQDKGALALMMIDVDFFKQFNDTYGHQMGDTCLCKVVEALKTEVRSGLDVLARFGGEEFVVILSDITTDKAQTVANRLRGAVQAVGLPHATRPDGLGVVTISVGAVFVDAGRGETPQQILQLADLALYDAKNRGRNMSVVRIAGESAMSDAA